MKKKPLAVAGGFAALIGLLFVTAPKPGVADTLKDVFVINNESSPVPIRDTENPARQPFQYAVGPTIPPGENQVCNENLTVPEGKMLVIEYVSAQIVLPLGQSVLSYRVYTDLGLGLGDGHHFVPHSVAQSGLSYFTVGQTTRLYAKSGNVRICAQRNSTTDSGVFSAGISGYLVDLP